MERKDQRRGPVKVLQRGEGAPRRSKSIILRSLWRPGLSCRLGAGRLAKCICMLVSPELLNYPVLPLRLRNRPVLGIEGRPDAHQKLAGKFQQSAALRRSDNSPYGTNTSLLSSGSGSWHRAESSSHG